MSARQVLFHMVSFDTENLTNQKGLYLRPDISSMQARWPCNDKRHNRLIERFAQQEKIRQQRSQVN